MTITMPLQKKKAFPGCWLASWPPYTEGKERLKKEANRSRLGRTAALRAALKVNLIMRNQNQNKQVSISFLPILFFVVERKKGKDSLWDFYITDRLLIIFFLCKIKVNVRKLL